MTTVTRGGSSPAENKPDNTEIITKVVAGLRQTAEKTVPRFLATMPQAYFHDTDQETRFSHIEAIVAIEATGQSQAITMRNKEKTRYTFISDQSYPGQLHKIVRRLPHKRPLSSAHIYTAADGSRVLDIIKFGEHASYDPGDPRQNARIEHVLEYARARDDHLDDERLAHHLRSCPADYLIRIPPAQAFRQYLLVEQIRSSQNSHVHIELRRKCDMSSVTVGVFNISRRQLFERITSYMGQQGVDIQRAYLDSFEQENGDVISLLNFLVDQTGSPLDPEGRCWQQIERDLKRIAYLDERVLELATLLPELDLMQAEVLLALSHLVHQRLVKQNPLAFSRERIRQTLTRHAGHAQAIAALFLERFTPGTDADNAAQVSQLAGRVSVEVDNQDECLILEILFKAISTTLRCNVHSPDRYALALRIDPLFLRTPVRDVVPFGVFFVLGNGFDGFHVRFRDIARGGVRIVRPLGEEQYALESERLYEEVYGLAHAQQLKNKDIPEGGSKGVILARPKVAFNQVGRDYADALLDLIVPDPEQKRLNRDYYGRDELLYLGPDENISNDLITWIVERAQKRGHPMPGAFMSSKPGAGINHKLYGVTSEGVTVFLEAALNAAGIDPRQRDFTIKMTGGPDGDVAGNEILILQREYGEHAHILGIADGSGCLEDPDGLDYTELTRLVKEELPVSHFSTSRLGPEGRLLTIDQPGGIQARNTFHNRLLTDAFIPAGGRPRTINEDNWKDFLTSAGTPSSRVIVEGANLFITQEARAYLSRQGVIIIKDSSANKCGVICSSYEIVASMLLSESGFLKIKDRFIDEVLIKLRELAGLEARTLLREHRHKPAESLPELSTRLSLVIDRATDAITNILESLDENDHRLTRRLIRKSLPSVLMETVGDRLFEHIPSIYLARVLASVLASHIVYREGLDWFEKMSEDSISDMAIRYLREEDTIQRLVQQIQGSNLPERERIAELLSSGGVAAALKDVRV